MESVFPPLDSQAGTSGTNGDLFPTPRLLACVRLDRGEDRVFPTPNNATPDYHRFPFV